MVLQQGPCCRQLHWAMVESNLSFFLFYFSFIFFLLFEELFHIWYLDFINAIRYSVFIHFRERILFYIQYL